jgi:hypothetical protein
MFALPYGSHSLAAGMLSTATILEEGSDDSDDGVLCLDGSMPVDAVEPEDFAADYEQAEQAGLSMALHQQVAQEGGEESLESHLVLMDSGSDSDDESGLATAQAAAAKRAAARAPPPPAQQRRSGGPDSRIRHLSERLRSVGAGKQRGSNGGGGGALPPPAML